VFLNFINALYVISDAVITALFSKKILLLSVAREERDVANNSNNIKGLNKKEKVVVNPAEDIANNNSNIKDAKKEEERVAKNFLDSITDKKIIDLLENIVHNLDSVNKNSSRNNANSTREIENKVD
jgi:hypothetical protein